MRSLFARLAVSLILVSVGLSLTVTLILHGVHDAYHLKIDPQASPALTGHPAAQSYWLEGAMWGLLATVVAGLAAAAIAARLATRALARLRHAMAAFAKAGFAATGRCGDGGKRFLADEATHLAAAFESMAQQVASRIDGLRQADESRKLLFAGVSHDLAAPLTALQGYIDTVIIKSDSLPESEKRRCLAVARRQIDHINGLVDRIRELVYLESPTLRMEMETLVVDELVRDVLERFSGDVEQKKLAVSVRSSDSASLVRGDRDLLERAIGNVVHNAIRFSPAGGELCVRIAPLPGTVELEITDQGPGIAPEDLGGLFQEFYRGKQPNWGGRLGSGLGLAIARKIVEHHDGVVWARNRAEGGASFHIALATGPGKAPED